MQASIELFMNNLKVDIAQEQYSLSTGTEQKSVKEF
jgi:hypothetical protein